MKVQVVQRKESGWETNVFELENLIPALEALGFKYAGQSRSWENSSKYSAVPRKELWNQPQFEGLCGPMYGGAEFPLRYECWKAYEALSI